MSLISAVLNTLEYAKKRLLEEHFKSIKRVSIIFSYPIERRKIEISGLFYQCVAYKLTHIHSVIIKYPCLFVNVRMKDVTYSKYHDRKHCYMTRQYKAGWLKWFKGLKA